VNWQSGERLLREMAVEVKVQLTARNPALERQGQRQSADFFQSAKRVRVYTRQDQIYDQKETNKHLVIR
jgi:hypothetical protein